jgi:hypothetical protein
MIILFASTFWTLTIAFVVGLCVAARLGDRQHEAGPAGRLAGGFTGPDAEAVCLARTHPAQSQGDFARQLG